MALYTPSGNPTNASRGLASVLRSEFALIAAGINAIAAEALTLTSKTINLTSNTLTGTKAQFNTACSDGNFLYDGGDLGTPSAGVLTNCTGTAAGLTAGAASAVAVGGITGLGTGVATALAANVGSAGAPLVFNGNIGTPSAGVLTNCTGLPIASGVSGLGTGVATFLATPSSANLAAALTDESGSGVVPFLSTGSWTPGLAFGTSGSATLTVTGATYSKIGADSMRISMDATVSGVTSPTGDVFVTGLPASATEISPVSVHAQSLASGSCFIGLSALDSATRISLRASDGTRLQGSSIQVGTIIRISGIVKI